MARVTVEDCAEVVKNRFELVALASQRAKSISSGAQIVVERDDDKNAVVALREIASKKVEPSLLREMLVKSHQRHVLNQTEENYLNQPVSEEVKQEMSSLQQDVNQDDHQNLLYGGDDVVVED